jgi:hypothetical protein
VLRPYCGDQPWPALLLNRLITSTPAMIRPMPNMMPALDQMA